MATLTKDGIRAEIAASKGAVALHEEGVLIQKIVLEAFERYLEKMPEEIKKK